MVLLRNLYSPGPFCKVETRIKPNNSRIVEYFVDVCTQYINTHKNMSKCPKPLFQPWRIVWNVDGGEGFEKELLKARNSKKNLSQYVLILFAQTEIFRLGRQKKWDFLIRLGNKILGLRVHTKGSLKYLCFNFSSTSQCDIISLEREMNHANHHKYV